MSKTLSTQQLKSSKSEVLIDVDEAYQCSSGCGKGFNTPITVNDLSNKPATTYSACPYCLSKVESVEEKSEEPVVEGAVLEEENLAAKKEEVKQLIEDAVAKPLPTEDSSEFKCPHYVGYLKKRAKDKPIPEECLTCSELIKCSL